MTTHIQSSSSLSYNASSPKQEILCGVCKLRMDYQDIGKGQIAKCPRCGTKAYRHKNSHLTHNLTMAITGLLLFIPSLFLPFVSIHLIGIPFQASLLTGTLALINEGFYLLGFIVFFCSILSPFLVFISIIAAHYALHYKQLALLRYTLRYFQIFKHWLTIDVFLLAILITTIKLNDYSQTTLGIGLLFMIATQLILMFLVYHLSIRQYWEMWKPTLDYQFTQPSESHCQHCHLSQPLTITCVRCKQTARPFKKRAAQKTWALLLAATLCVFPANYLIISVFYSNGLRIEDTIFSGVVSFIDTRMPVIASVIFLVSIIVPITKILIIAYLLCIIKIKRFSHPYQKMKLYLFTQWIGKWSILDLYVIAITMSLIDRDQLLDFSPGPAAVAFAGVVVFTMLATESLDPRLIWQNAPSAKETHSILTKLKLLRKRSSDPSLESARINH